MVSVQCLVDRVQQADAERIDLPVLRHLVNEVQSKSPQQVSRDAQAWTDTNWSQWKQHSSHNPW